MPDLDLVPLFMETGLLQFGRFADGDDAAPFRLNLELLPAYPDVLKELVSLVRDWLLSRQVNRLVSTSEAVPFGIALSLETGIPLVYSRGSNLPAVHDLVGAYDIGHPAALVTNVFNDGEAISRFLNRAKHVGLDIHSLIVLAEPGTALLPDDIAPYVLLSLPAVVKHLMDTDQIPVMQGQTVLDWIERKRHPK